MSDHYPSVGAYTIGQQITVVMLDSSEVPSRQTIRPAVCVLDPDRAREFALELLAIATAADKELAR